MIGILPCAGKGTRFYELGKVYPKCILPYKEKPLLIYNIDWLQKQGCEKIYIIADHQKNKIQDVINNYNLSAEVLAPPNDEGLSVSILTALNKIQDESVMILLGDMIVKDHPSLESFDWVATHKVDDWQRWCMFDESRNTFYDKPIQQPNTNQALSGIYFIKNAITLRKSIKKQLQEKTKIKNEYQLSTALEKMNVKFHSKQLKTLDFGSIEQYLKNRNINKSRAFNSISFAESIVTKKSKQRSKIYQEFSWFKNLPLNIKVHTPKIYSSNFFKKQAEYSMEKINFPTLRELFLFFDRDQELWSNILVACDATYDKMISYEYEGSALNSMMLKLKSRTQRISDQKKIKDFYDKFYSLGEEMENSIHLMHGDFCFSNLFWNKIDSKIIMIDPRGDLFGSKYYDWAKLKHSINYHYDFIDAELYTVNQNKISLFNEGCDEIKKIFDDLEKRRFNKKEREYLDVLTASLFLTMIPLHADKPQNQKIFYNIFEEVFDNQ